MWPLAAASLLKWNLGNQSPVVHNTKTNSTPGWISHKNGASFYTHASLKWHNKVLYQYTIYLTQICAEVPVVPSWVALMVKCHVYTQISVRPAADLSSTCTDLSSYICAGFIWHKSRIDTWHCDVNTADDWGEKSAKNKGKGIMFSNSTSTCLTSVFLRDRAPKYWWGLLVSSTMPTYRLTSAIIMCTLHQQSWKLYLSLQNMFYFLAKLCH